MVRNIKIVRGIRKAIRNVKNRVTTAITKRNGYPPQVRQVLEQYGDVPILNIMITRTPINPAIKSALNAVSFGAFSKRLNRLPFDKLFHLKMDVLLANGKTYGVEKNEVIKIAPPNNSPNTERRNVNEYNSGLTLNLMLANGETAMGDRTVG